MLGLLLLCWCALASATQMVSPLVLEGVQAKQSRYFKDAPDDDENGVIDDPIAAAVTRQIGEFDGCYILEGNRRTRVHTNRMGCSCMGEGDSLTVAAPSQNVVASFSAADTAQQYPEMEAVTPVAWLHIPKCGSSFLNVLYHHPDICPFTPPEAELAHTSDTCETPVPEWLAMYPEQMFCTGVSTSFPFEPAGHNHFGITDELYALNKGNWMTMVRQPEQRTISGWNHAMHSWAHPIPPANVREYAEGMQGCQTRMIGGHSAPGNRCGMTAPLPGGLPSAELVSNAKFRLRDGFSFVGVTERWEESICLFHAMFGGPCLELEFDNTRSGYARFDSDEPYDVTELEGFVDEFDGAVFAEAERIFNATLQQYNINLETCTSLCPAHFSN